LGQQILPDRLVLFGDEPAHLLGDFVKLLPGSPSAGIDFIHARFEDAEESADPDHKKLIEVRTENGGELEFFQGGS
jgi:hypothetical protein